MSSEKKIEPILDRLSRHFFPEEDDRYWQALSLPTKNEEEAIKIVRSFSQEKKEELTEEIKKNDWHLLGFLIDRFSNVFSKEPFDEQILTLIRAIESYKDPQKRGLVLQMATGEGKSSVTIPLLTAFLYFKGERIEIYEINPFLLREGYEQFLRLAKELGIEEQVGFLENYQDKGAHQKSIVFGYWPNFIHRRQHQFLTDEKENHQKAPIIILDEVDPLLNEEAMIPAIIGGKEERTILVVDELRKRVNQLMAETEEREKSLINEKLKKFKFRGKEIDLSIEEEPENPEEFFKRMRFIFEHLSYMVSESEDFQTMSFQEKRKVLFQSYIWGLLINNFEEASNVAFENLSDEEKKTLESVFPYWFSSLWFSNFEPELIDAFLMEEGRDYIVENENQSDSSMAKIKIIPLAPQTGYPERNKRFNFLTNLFLLIKHAQSLDQLPETINIEEIDKMSILAYYVNAIQSGSKIFGFTGTATAVAKRLREVYGLETTVLPTHFETKRQENPMEFFENSERKIEKLIDILRSDGSKNTLIMVEKPEEAEAVQKAIDESLNDIVDFQLLSARNEEEDSRLYQWLSQKGEKRRILICVKMVGRGVDLKPDEDLITEGGFLLISLTSFKYRRSYQQLLGRVGRRGEKGEVYTLVSLDDEIFSYLSEEEKTKLTQFIKQGRLGKIQKAVKRAWDYWEDEITQRMRYWIIFSAPIERIRLWIEGKIDLKFYEEKEILSHNLNPEEFRRYLHTWWTDILKELEDTYQAWLVAGSLTPFGQAQDPKSFWTNYVFSYLRDRFLGEFF